MKIDEKTLLPTEDVKPMAIGQLEFDVDFFINMDTPLKNSLQERFAQYIVQGKSATEAYRLAHKENSKKEIKDKSCTERGCRLLSDSNVVNRIKFLNRAVTKQIIMSDLELHKHLADIIRDKSRKTADRINAIKVLAQIKGLAKGDTEVHTSQHFVNLQVEVVEADKKPEAEIQVVEVK